jgi:hypothetical protein
VNIKNLLVQKFTVGASLLANFFREQARSYKSQLCNTQWGFKLILILLLPHPAAQAEGLGRLFFTPAQRAQLDHHNYKPTATVTNTDIATYGEETDRTVTVNGIVQRDGGKRTAWINGAARTVEQSDDNTSVMFTLPDQNKMVRLKVGQHVKLNPAANSNNAKPSVEKPTLANDN